MSPGLASVVINGAALTLLFEVVDSAQWLARIVSFAAVYDGSVFVLAGLRAVVTALQTTTVFMLFERRPSGPRFATVSLLSSAVLMTLEIGLGLAPSSTSPGFRWPTVAAYWGYAGILSWLLRRTAAGR